MFIDIKSKLLKKIISNYILKFLFYEISYENGDILKCGNLIFEYDDFNGNPGNLKNYYRTDGFWNYIKIKNDLVFDTYENKFITKSEIYKNSIELASEEEKLLFKSLLRLSRNIN